MIHAFEVGSVPFQPSEPVPALATQDVALLVAHESEGLSRLNEGGNRCKVNDGGRAGMNGQGAVDVALPPGPVQLSVYE